MSFFSFFFILIDILNFNMFLCIVPLIVCFGFEDIYTTDKQIPVKISQYRNISNENLNGEKNII